MELRALRPLLRHTIPLAAIGCFLRFVACANGTDTSGDLTGGDGTDNNPGPDDATTGGEGSADDAQSSADAGCADGHTGPGCATCASGFHACGAACTGAQPNYPEAGCAMGCGTSCPAPASGYATCNDAGACDFACGSGVVLDSGSCGCPSGQRVCSDGACHACCTDSDCPAHRSCGGGVCGGCTAGWGDCDGTPANGCETSLQDTNNCGSCGNSCCSGFLCCGLFGSESCTPSGTQYSCQC
jgi:hypothetical protein